MSGREWKPGDVAVAQAGDSSYVIFRAEVPGKGREVRWHDKFGPLLADSEWPSSRNIRPLVVIDPEDREQVERLVACVYEQPFKSRIIDQWANALREFADPKPAKPEEPTGLGAVVEADHGRRYVRAGEGWLPERVPGPFRNPVDWDGITAVRVLSEGVQAGESA